LRAKRLLEALDRFLEAVHDIERQRALGALVKTLEAALAKAFHEQGKLFLGRLGKAVKPDDPAELASLAWEAAWLEVAEKTAPAMAKAVDAAARKALLAGAARQIAELGLALSFDLKNPRAVAFLQDYGATRITKVNDTTKEIIRGILVQGVEEGQSYNKIAQAISERFHEFAVGKPQEHIDSRAHLVAVTETANAYEEGNMIVAREIRDAGIELEKHWLTVGDERVSDGCQENEEAGWIPLDEPFPSGDDRPPRFPGCRCDLQIRRKED
jgi:Phage Mu protein F like protein.